MKIIPNDLQQSVGQFGLQCGNTQVNKQFVQAGRLKFHLKEWEEITSNKFILDVVQGYVIEFISVLIQSSQPKQPKLEKHEEIALNALLEGLLQKRVIEKCAHEAGEFFSPVFLGPKKNGKYRMILNLKSLNKFISHIHFKMDTLQSCINLMTKNCFMASPDLTDAYYSVSMSPDSQKYLEFQVGSQLYKFITLPNGLSSAPRIFAKLMKPVHSTLRTRGLVSSGYLDYSFLLGDSFVLFRKNFPREINIHAKQNVSLTDTEQLTLVFMQTCGRMSKNMACFLASSLILSPFFYFKSPLDAVRCWQL